MTSDLILWIYGICLVVGAIFNVLRGLIEGSRFVRYMEEHHPERWEQIVYGQLLRKVFLFPFGRGTVFDFVWRSTEEYGDPMIGVFRRKAKRFFYGWLLYCALGFLGFVVLAMIFGP